MPLPFRFRSARLLPILVLLALAAWAPVSQATEQPDAKAVVSSFYDALFPVWRDSAKLSKEERFQRLEGPVQQAFDLEAMIRIATGTAWTKATDAERAALVSAFSRYSVAGWADRFDTYDGQSLRVLGDRGGPRDSVIVETQIAPASGDPVQIDYVVDGKSGANRIIDVVAKGVSELARLRADYAGILRSDGPGALAKRINEVTDQVMAE